MTRFLDGYASTLENRMQDDGLIWTPIHSVTRQEEQRAGWECPSCEWITLRIIIGDNNIEDTLDLLFITDKE